MDWRAQLTAQAIGLARKHGPDLAKKYGSQLAVGAAKKAGTRLNARQQAIDKAQSVGGRYGKVVVEGQHRYVVFKDDEVLDIYPTTSKPLEEAVRGLDRSTLKDPAALPVQRALRVAQSIPTRRLRRDRGPTEGDSGNPADLEVVAQRFHDLIDKMASDLARLLEAEARPVGEHSHIPDEPGVYLFSRPSGPLYVGQSRKIAQRLRQHTRKSSTENQASLAFNMALIEAAARRLELPKTRKERAGHEQFARLFLSAKEELAAMDCSFILLADPVERTIFEMYATEALGTAEFNSFETH